MELKNYQQDVIRDIEQFNRCLLQEPNLKQAFRSFWEGKGVCLGQAEDSLHEYVNSVPGVPRIAIKVPTAGGKTFIACNALRAVFDAFEDGRPQVVAWIVPSDTILKQTYEKLNDPHHPYRQKIDTLFSGKVRVYDKDALLMGQNFGPVEVKEQLSILVLSIQSFATNTKEGRLSYRENEYLTEFEAAYTESTPRVKDAGKSSLIQVIAHLNPVVVIDESHNFTASLRVETLQSINPKYVLELTATPKQNSNIVSFVDAIRLKRENMVKLPVIVYNHHRISDVVNGAINLRNNLEAKALEHEAKGGGYIRPIVLFQAQPRAGKENETFDKVKAKLVEIGIPEEQIRIKTAERDELKQTDLMSRTCPVRYIITVDALKEGWDCPFAYVLASLANKISRISVEQILGRVLRQPYTRRHACDFLNLSYVFTCSADFQRTLAGIVETLNNLGFSSKDFFAKDHAADEPALPAPSSRQPDWFAEAGGKGSTAEAAGTEAPAGQEAEGADDCGAEDFERMDARHVRERVEDGYGGAWAESDLQEAQNRSQQYDDAMERTPDDDNHLPDEAMKHTPRYEMKASFAEVAKKVALPQFFLPVVKSQLFGSGEEQVLLAPIHLLKGFCLQAQDKNIVFEQTAAEVGRIDLEERRKDEYVPKFMGLKEKQLKEFSKFISGLDTDGKLRQLVARLVGAMRKKYQSVSDPALNNYVASVLQMQDACKLQQLADNVLNTKAAFENKIDSLLDAYKVEQFSRMLDTGRLRATTHYHLPNAITVKECMAGVPKSLYLEEESVDGFEYRVITQIANLDNVLFWHRNQERGKGFFINGFTNHYPDFLVVTKAGKVLLVETKGGHLDGSDAERKLLLGKAWAAKAGEGYGYFMVFDHKKIAGAYALSDFIELLKEL